MAQSEECNSPNSETLCEDQEESRVTVKRKSGEYEDDEENEESRDFRPVGFEDPSFPKIINGVCQPMVFPPMTDPQDKDLQARIRHQSFQAGLRLMYDGLHHVKKCTAARPWDHVNGCICVPREGRPGRRKAPVIVSEMDLMVFPRRQLDEFIHRSGLERPQYSEYVRYIREVWSYTAHWKQRLPDDVCDLGRGRLTEFRQLQSSAGLTPNGVCFLKEERDRSMNRQHQHAHRVRRKTSSDSASEPYEHRKDFAMDATLMAAIAQGYGGRFPDITRMFDSRGRPDPQTMLQAAFGGMFPPGVDVLSLVNHLAPSPATCSASASTPSYGPGPRPDTPSAGAADMSPNLMAAAMMLGPMMAAGVMHPGQYPPRQHAHDAPVPHGPHMPGAHMQAASLATHGVPIAPGPHMQPPSHSALPAGPSAVQGPALPHGPPHGPTHGMHGAAAHGVMGPPSHGAYGPGPALGHGQPSHMYHGSAGQHAPMAYNPTVPHTVHPSYGPGMYPPLGQQGASHGGHPGPAYDHTHAQGVAGPTRDAPSKHGQNHSPNEIDAARNLTQFRTAST